MRVSAAQMKELRAEEKQKRMQEKLQELPEQVPGPHGEPLENLSMAGRMKIARIVTNLGNLQKKDGAAGTPTSAVPFKWSWPSAQKVIENEIE